MSYLYIYIYIYIDNIVFFCYTLSYLSYFIGVNDLQKILNSLTEKEVVVDCRTRAEYESGHIPGAINIPMGNELDQLSELQDYRKIYLYCQSGRRSQSVYTSLMSKGLDNMICLRSSGMAEWKKYGYHVETK